MNLILKTLFILITCILYAVTAQAQFMRDSQDRALDSLAKLKIPFQKTRQDSVFISKHSDEKYKFYFFMRGDQAEDIEEQIYNTKPGEVAGPFKGEGQSNFLFKVVSFDGYTARNKASLIYLKAEDPSRTDKETLKKLAKKYADLISKGKSAGELAQKDKVRLVNTDLKYYYEEQKDKEYFDLVMNAEKGKTFVVDTQHGPAILMVTSDKEKVPYKVKLIAVVKKG